MQYVQNKHGLYECLPRYVHIYNQDTKRLFDPEIKEDFREKRGRGEAIESILSANG